MYREGNCFNVIRKAAVIDALSSQRVWISLVVVQIVFGLMQQGHAPSLK